MISVLLADDQSLVRSGLRMLIDSADDMTTVGEVDNGRDAVAAVRTRHIDVVLMDIRMPVMDGIEATRQITASGVDTKVLVLTTFDLDEYVFAALQAGAKGFLLKDAGAELLAQAIRAAARGDALIAPNVTVRLLEAFADASPAAPPPQPVEPLTEREEQVLAKVALGLGNSEIASELYVSLSTVKTHIASLMTKLGARNRVEIAIWAHQTGRVRARTIGEGPSRR